MDTREVMVMVDQKMFHVAHGLIEMNDDDLMMMM